MKEEKLSVRNKIIIGFTLFSMFFGAGNLIFPPMLGAQAGSHTVPAMAGLLITAVLLPLLAVAACSRHGDLVGLGSLVHPAFGKILTVLIVLLIGPVVAIPRTCSTSFEMAVKPFLNTASGSSDLAARMIYAALFFAAAALVARHPGKLMNLLGKIMTPVLIVLIAVLFAAALFKMPHLVGDPNTAEYAKTPFFRGFSEGYQTMDALAGLNFAIVIAANIKNLGIKSERAVRRETGSAMIIAAVMLSVLYMALAYTGMVCSGTEGLLHGNTTGADILSYVINTSFGKAGQVFNAAIFFVACFNVCCALLSSCSTYFSRLFPRISFGKWLLAFSVFSFAISSMGLYSILSFSFTILKVLYPITIAVVILGFIRPAGSRPLIPTRGGE